MLSQREILISYGAIRPAGSSLTPSTAAVKERVLRIDDAGRRMAERRVSRFRKGDTETTEHDEVLAELLAAKRKA